MTVVILLLTMLYAILRLIVLMRGSNPQINVITSRNLIQNDEILNLNEMNYRMAFVVEGFADKRRRSDPRYVKYIARIWNEVGSEQVFTNVPIRECTDEDLDQFYPVDSASKLKYDSIYNDENHGFFCIDWQ